jgi:SAM-dependent MidA family methyltransferase
MPEDDTGLHRQRVPAGAELEPDAHQRAHAERVRERLMDEIRAAGGWIGFERFMEIALYEPGLGYYSAGARKFGAAGDFVTAPEISPLFGGCLARQCAQVLETLGGGSILEIGPGSGRLAVDLLRELEHLQRLPARYWLLEPSADLRERQRALIGTELPQLAERCAWLDAPPAGGLRGVVLANEVLDALPVRRFRHRAGRYEELGVAGSTRGFVWSARAGDAALESTCRALEALGGPWPAGYESEFCPRLSAFTSTIAAALERGLALWIDYGLPRREYYAAQRAGGTLLAHFRHRAFEEPLGWPGLMDITAWVDFTALAEAADAALCELAGFTTQTHFLAALGIDELIARHTGEARVSAIGQAHRLLLPGEMGERFKVMGWVRGLDADLRGFRLRDLRHTL